MPSALPIFLLVPFAVACGPVQVQDEAENAPTPPSTAAPDTTRSPALVVDTSAHVLVLDTTVPPKQRPTSSVSAEPQCREEIYIENNQGRITVFIPKRQLASRTSEIRDLLPGVFLQAERTSPYSIADDFERGISTVHSSMPDKLPVEVMVFERCRSTTPHTVLQLRVWRETDGSFGSEGW